MIVGHRWNQLRAFYRTLAVTAAFLGCAFASANANAQFLLNRLGVVGGVKIDADGVVQAATQEDRAGMLRELREKIVSPAGKIASSTKLRMVSLAKLQKEIERALAAKEELSDEVRYMAGLQRIEYVFVYPETNDIVLAGPAEGWQVRDDASVVGVTTGRPVLQLEDLLVALRTVKASQQQAITVSIDPTPAGEKRLQQLLGSLRTGPGFDPSQYEAKMKEAFGPQQVTLTTVANTSRMARTLVAADYRMKTLAMNIESSPVAGLPSYMEMIRNNGAPTGTQPRWWMSCEYDALLKSGDGLAWQLTGQGVKALTEEEFVEANGARKSAGRKNKLAQKWADQFTAKFDELCTHNSAFGDLRNVMDLNVVATLIEANNLEQAAGIDLGLLKSGAKLETPSWESPKTIPAHCSFVSGRAGWTVSASGGVEINPWKVVAQQTKTDEAVSLVRTKASTPGNSWWW